MSRRKRKTLIRQALVLLILLAAYVLVDQVMKAQDQKKLEEARQEEEALTLVSLDEENAVELTLQTEGNTLRFTREEGVWTCPDDPYFEMNEEKIRRLVRDLSPLTAKRRLDGIGDLSLYGLSPAKGVISVRSRSGEETTLKLGSRNDATGELYIQLEASPDTVYLAGTSLDRDAAGDLKSFAAYEDAPVLDPSGIRRIEVKKETDSFTLVTPGDDQCTVEEEDGQVENADLSAAGLVQNRLANLTWLANLEYHCEDPAAYGLDIPYAVITVDSEDGSQVRLLLSSLKPDGNYNVMLEGSTQVHTVRGEYLKDLAEGKARDFWRLTYSFVSIGDLDTLTVGYEGKEHTLRTAAADPAHPGEITAWYADDQEVEKEHFTDFYYKCVSITAQERLPEVPDVTTAPLLTLHYQLKDGTEKEMRYYEAGQDFCLVIYEDGTKAAYVNRLYVKDMMESLEKVLR